jgi:A/G-specific adenine glycosylase
MTDARRLQTRLLDWYDAGARDLPWRVGPRRLRRGERPDPYRVWLSEVMLQQTTAAHATPYFLRFVERWPSVEALAGADDADVMAAWAGLGYYARARNLLKCAREVADRLQGRFPDTEQGLRALPGVGDYTAAAVAAIAFDRPAVVVDGNVERVVARLFAVESPMPAAKGDVRRLAATLVEPRRPGDWAQALMDLGATVCRPKSPLCDRCPVSGDCAALAAGSPETFPRRTKSARKPNRHGVAWLATHGARIALLRRPATGLLGGMLALPTTEWRGEAWRPEEVAALAPLGADWRFAGSIEHVFTHFALKLDVLQAETATAPEGASWIDLDAGLAALPSVFLKAARQGLSR